MMFKINSWHRALFWEWCQANNILCEYMGSEHDNPFSMNAMDTWYIGNEKDRTLAILRWS